MHQADELPWVLQWGSCIKPIYCPVQALSSPCALIEESASNPAAVIWFAWLMLPMMLTPSIILDRRVLHSGQQKGSLCSDMFTKPDSAMACLPRKSCYFPGMAARPRPPTPQVTSNGRTTAPTPSVSCVRSSPLMRPTT